MGELEFFSTLIGNFCTLISVFIWPILIFIFLAMFKRDLSSLIARIKSLEGVGLRINWAHGDSIEHPSKAIPTKPIQQYIQVTSIPSAEAFGEPTVIQGAPKLSQEESVVATL